MKHADILNPAIRKPVRWPVPSTGDQQDAVLSHKAVEFLSALPVTSDTRVWGIAFRENLKSLLGDVDHIIVSVVLGMNLRNPVAEQDRPDTKTLRHSVNLKTSRSQIRISQIEKKRKDLCYWEQLVEEAEANDVPLERYQGPVGFDFHYEGVVCGGLILLRYKENTPISQATLDFIESLKDFFVYVFTAHIAIKRVKEPQYSGFQHLLRKVSLDRDLTEKEQDILLYQLLGLSYEQTADRMNVSINTVKAHIKSVYAKIGCNNIKEAFSRYLTPIGETPI